MPTLFLFLKWTSSTNANISYCYHLFWQIYFSPNISTFITLWNQRLSLIEKRMGFFGSQSSDWQMLSPDWLVFSCHFALCWYRATCLSLGQGQGLVFELVAVQKKTKSPMFFQCLACMNRATSKLLTWFFIKIKIKIKKISFSYQAPCNEPWDRQSSLQTHSSPSVQTAGT